MRYPSKKIFFFSLVLLSILLVLSLFLVQKVHEAIYEPNKASSGTVKFTVKRGESGLTTLAKLQSKGLVKNYFLARLYFRLQQWRGQLIEAGEYQFPASLSLAQIYQRLQHGTFEVQVTLPEGLRLEEIALIFNKEMGLDYASFVAEGEKWRGFLFPDTYRFNRDLAPAAIITILRRNFDRRVDENLRQAYAQEGLSLKQAVILASIVEREAQTEEDQRRVAGILIKRWRNNWPLEADATVQFAQATHRCPSHPFDCNWWPPLQGNDLEIDSPFNTRRYPGLPPQPIASPGRQALKAVAFPEPSPYWFYLSDSEGKIHYARNYTEHQQNIRRYLN